MPALGNFRLSSSIDDTMYWHNECLNSQLYQGGQYTIHNKIRVRGLGKSLGLRANHNNSNSCIIVVLQ